MIDADFCRTFAAYNEWMNRKLYALCAGMTVEMRRRDRGAFFGSIHATLNHGRSPHSRIPAASVPGPASARDPASAR